MNVVEFLRKTCELSHQFSEEEIHSTCGILDVNAYEIRLFDNDGAIRYEMTVRATVPINKGEQIFASYTMPLEGNLMKPYTKVKIKVYKYFGIIRNKRAGNCFTSEQII